MKVTTFLVLGLLVAASLHDGRNYIHFQWTLGMAACLLGFTWFAVERVGWLQAATALYTLGVSLAIFGSPRWLMYEHTPESIYAQLYQNSIYAFCCFFAISAVLVTAPDKLLRSVLAAIPIYTLINVALVVAGHLTGGIGGGWNQPPPGNAGATAFLDYSGMNGCLIAIGIPTLASRPWRNTVKALAYLLAIAAIVISSSSVAWGVLTLVIISRALHEQRVRAHVLAEGLTLGVISLIALYYWHGIDGYDSAGRFQAYRIFIGEWWNHEHVTFGFGPGSFPALNRLIQTKHQFMVEKGVMWNWLWLHSDWLQSAFELGIVGFCLYVATAASVLVHLWRERSVVSRDLFGMASGLCATAALNYPARYFICAFLMAFVAVASRRLTKGA
jgi:O-antigen ligase